jgi:antitoxin FitA
MATVTVRNLPEAVHRAIRVRAAEHGRSAEAEIREILAASVLPIGRLKIGTELRQFAAQLDGVELVFARDQTLINPAKFE